MPDHIRKILYLDAPDLIVEKDNEPIFSVEISTEAGTGHNAFQRFARLAASVENNVPTLYVYPNGKVITRNGRAKWDNLNALIFRALENIMSIYNVPAFLYYFPTARDYCKSIRPEDLSQLPDKGIVYDKDAIKYAGCPDASAKSMKTLFAHINTIIKNTEKEGVRVSQPKLLRLRPFQKYRRWMQEQFSNLAKRRKEDAMSPLSAVTVVPTKQLLNYLQQYENGDYHIGELLRQRSETVIYQANAEFRGDPYPGALAAIDYLKCRKGVTYEDRHYNLVLLFGKLQIKKDGTLSIECKDSKSTIQDFFKAVQKSSGHSLLDMDYDKLKPEQKPRYFMQVRYGSTYSKVKHIRVYSYFADAILFPDGALWRDA